ncbi:hypothetical protein IFT80_04315 [Pseudomonas sp. CFBP 8771]|uniref:hypothetical protein n=1 Tax=Pseudomonas sp. CFBP 8771 TaxID=2775285 RepID=UPI00177F8F7B|nr:hypothetical protein [Pseudomonas sp. CFBP 8771]MBD8601865.1 hypothetical protein [Pseudomonas sp. CFBP 8771]
MRVLDKSCLPISTIFKAERSMMCRAFTEERVFTASIELTGNVVTCILDDSEYSFTAQQCGELADSLATLLKISTERAASQVKIGLPLKLDFCKIFYQLILSRSSASGCDRLYGYDYDSDLVLFGASGSFRYPGTRDSYKLFVGFNDELCLPFLGIEDWVYTFCFDEASWLIEQLCVGGYLLAQIEQTEKESKKNGRNYQ